MRVPARNLYRVDDSVELDEAALTEPLACVVWGVERLQLMRKPCPDLRRGTDRFLLTALLSASGTADVTVVDVVDSKLEIARRFGASANHDRPGPRRDPARAATGSLGMTP